MTGWRTESIRIRQRENNSNTNTLQKQNNLQIKIKSGMVHSVKCSSSTSSARQLRKIINMEIKT